MTKVFLVPNPGMKVRNPRGGYLKDEGETVTLDRYWRRRIAEGGCAPGETQSAPGEEPSASGEDPVARVGTQDENQSTTPAPATTTAAAPKKSRSATSEPAQ